MKKINFFFLVLFTACSSTKIIKYSALPRIVMGEGILMMSIKSLSENQQYNLFQTGSKILSKSNKLKFILELEYYLATQGIGKDEFYRNSVSDSIISILATKTNSRYILYVEKISSKQGEAFGSYTSLELNRYHSHYYQGSETNSASLLFRIIDTKVNLTESKFQVNTKIGPLIIDEKNGETRVNMTTELTAIIGAFRKGMKQLKKGVLKPTINKT